MITKKIYIEYLKRYERQTAVNVVSPLICHLCRQLTKLPEVGFYHSFRLIHI